MKMNKDVDSALHILKGAVQDVLGATMTTSVFADGPKGRLTVELAQKPSDEEMAMVEEKANKKIEQNVPIEMFKMDREKAELTYGEMIYDRFPVPEEVKELTLTMIEGWNINCCRGPHHRSTGSVPPIRIVKWRHRPSRKDLEVSFVLG